MKFRILFLVLVLFGFPLVGASSQTREGERSADAVPNNPEISFDDTYDVPRGFYMGLTGGYWYFTNEDDRSLYGDAWLTGIKFGYDILKYLGVELQYKFSAHQNASRGVVANSTPGSHWSHQISGFIRGMYPISRRWTVSLDAGGGMWVTRPNIKVTISQNARGIGTGALGVQYFTKIKGVVIGIDPSLSVAQDMGGAIIQASGYIRYTF